MTPEQFATWLSQFSFDKQNQIVGVLHGLHQAGMTYPDAALHIRDTVDNSPEFSVKNNELIHWV